VRVSPHKRLLKLCRSQRLRDFRPNLRSMMVVDSTDSATAKSARYTVQPQTFVRERQGLLRYKWQLSKVSSRHRPYIDQFQQARSKRRMHFDCRPITFSVISLMVTLYQLFRLKIESNRGDAKTRSLRER
jgi:hypothetical protein